MCRGMDMVHPTLSLPTQIRNLENKKAPDFSEALCG